MDGQATKRAEQLRDQVLKTWMPPLQAGGECAADIAQTSVMLSLAYVFGKDFLGPLQGNQSAAIDSGLKLFHNTFKD